LDAVDDQFVLTEVYARMRFPPQAANIVFSNSSQLNQDIQMAIFAEGSQRTEIIQRISKMFEIKATKMDLTFICPPIGKPDQNFCTVSANSYLSNSVAHCPLVRAAMSARSRVSQRPCFRRD
jgi:hypothetical protein